MIYGEMLKELREEKEIKQYELSNLLNFERSVYGQFEREETIIPIKHLNTLCNYFNVSIDYIFGFTNIRNYKSKDVDLIVSGNRLKEIRRENKLTQKKLASILNTTQSNIVGYEKGKFIIPTLFLYTICRKYYISADYLLGRIDSPKYLK